MTQRIEQNNNPDSKATELLAGAKKALGMVPNLFSTIAHSSAALAFHVNGSSALQHTHISAALREQIAVSTSGFNGCDYCASAHTLLGAMRKVEPSELALNLHGKSYNTKTQAALTFSRRVLETRGHIADGDLDAIRAAGYTEADIVEIIATTVDTVFTNYFNNVAKTVIDFPLVSTGKEA